jgi:hypothetical protein
MQSDLRVPTGQRNSLLAVYLSWLALLVPLIIISALTKFHTGNSTKAQRIWTMTWLSVGTMFGAPLSILSLLMNVKPDKEANMKWDRGGILRIFASVCLILFYVAPAIGGFVVVGQMLRSYGTCISV